MSEANKTYIRSHELWLKAENLNADIIHHEIFHSAKMAKLYAAKSELMEEVYDHSLKAMKLAEEQFGEWKAEIGDADNEAPAATLEGDKIRFSLKRAGYRRDKTIQCRDADLSQFAPEFIENIKAKGEPKKPDSPADRKESNL